MDSTLNPVETIGFEARHGRNGPCVGMQLGWHFVFKSIFEQAWRRISASIANADKSQLHTAQSLFRHENWRNLSFGYRIAIGRCLRYFVKLGWLPLMIANPNSTGTKKYLVVARSGESIPSISTATTQHQTLKSL